MFVGATGATVIVTVSGALFTVPSLTVSENTSVVALAGAVKLGIAIVALLSVTGGPDVCVHV